MCDTVVVVTPECVWFAKNSDRDPNEAQLLEWQPRRSHLAGTTLQCTWICVPQVRETHAVLISRPFWMWGAEIGSNEHGVTIGNEAVFTDQPYAKSGLTGMDLLRLALERAATASDALQVITALLEQHGQGGGCGHEKRSFTYHNSFIIADPHAAYVLETAGKEWAIEQVHGARSISNGLTIPDFAARHADRLTGWGASCKERQCRTQQLATAATGPADLMRLLRDHGQDRSTPHYSWLNGGLHAACAHAGGLVASLQTTASWVAELRPGAVRHWATGTAAPCLGLFKPVAVDEPVRQIGTPGDAFDPDTLWWRHERWHRVAIADAPRWLPAIASERDAMERQWIAQQQPSQQAFDVGDRLLERWQSQLAGQAVPDSRPIWTRRYWRTRERRAGMPALRQARD